MPDLDLNVVDDVIEQKDQRIAELEGLLHTALDEFADHQSWRCAHPDRYSHDPDCPCGLVVYGQRARAALG